MLVEPLFTLSSIQKATDELVFEDFGFQSFCVSNAAVSTHAYQAHKSPTSILARGRTSLVVDSGFSFTHATPVFQSKVEDIICLTIFKHSLIFKRMILGDHFSALERFLSYLGVWLWEISTVHWRILVYQRQIYFEIKVLSLCKNS